MSPRNSIVKQYADLQEQARLNTDAIARVQERNAERIEKIAVELRGAVGHATPLRVFDAGPGRVVVVRLDSGRITINVSVIERWPTT